MVVTTRRGFHTLLRSGCLFGLLGFSLLGCSETPTAVDPPASETILPPLGPPPGGQSEPEPEQEPVPPPTLEEPPATQPPAEEPPATLETEQTGS